MEKFTTVAGLILAQSIEDLWVTYSEQNQSDSERGGVDLIYIKDGEVGTIFLELINGKVIISGVIDESFNEGQYTEILNLIKVRYKEKQEYKRVKAWEKLGIFNG